MDKEFKHNLIYKLNNIGLDFKRKTLGRSVNLIVNECSVYFCRYFCRYSKFCEELTEEEKPWCPLDELN